MQPNHVNCSCSSYCLLFNLACSEPKKLVPELMTIDRRLSVQCAAARAKSMMLISDGIRREKKKEKFLSSVDVNISGVDLKLVMMVGCS